MLRELIDITFQEDFVHGLSRVTGLRVGTYDADGGVIVVGGQLSGYARLAGRTLGRIPAGLTLTPVPAHDPPATVAYIDHQGSWYVAAPVYCDDQLAGWVAAGEFRDPADPPELTLPEVRVLWERLPVLDRSGTSAVVIAARWGARLLAHWCQRESRLTAANEEAALVGDIAELLTGRLELPAVLNRIVAETARVMRCESCSLRLYDPQTGELRMQAVHGLPADYLDKGPVRRADSSIDDEALRGRIVYVEDAGRDPRVQYPDEMRRAGIVSILTAGLLHRGQPVGVIRVYRNRRQRFRQTQRTLLRAVANQAATAIVHAQLVEQRLHLARIERQVALAAGVQARMMRIPPPRVPGLATARVYQPSFHLGGDFCDIFALPDGRLAAAVADVAGKGLPASLLSASVRGALIATAEAGGDLGTMLTRLNLQVCAEMSPAEFVTLLLVAVDPQQLRIGYASAGHEPLLLLRDRQVQELSEGGLVLGASADEVYGEYSAELRRGDVLLLYTDGAIDAENFSGELFGRARLAAGLQQYGGLVIEQVLRNVLWDIRRFVGLAEQADDITMVGIRCLSQE